MPCRMEVKAPLSELVFGATDRMPLRALGYVTSAVTLAKTYLPKAQVQMVHTLHTAERVNQVDKARAGEQAKRFALMSSRVIDLISVTHLTDPQELADIDESAVAEAVAQMPQHEKAKLQAYSTGKGNMLAYVAAHLQLHDTAATLLPLREDDQAPITPKRIISLGAQSERPFYLARMACRRLGVEIPDLVDETSQLFTRHVLPPYRMCREGEPHVDQLDRNDPLELVQQNSSVTRDLGYLAAFLAKADSQAYIQGAGNA